MSVFPIPHDRVRWLKCGFFFSRQSFGLQWFGLKSTPVHKTMPKSKKKADLKKINYSLLPELVGYHLRLTQLAVFRDFAESVGEAQITPSLYAVLVIIDANPGLKQTELAKAVRLDRSSVVSVIDKLEKQKLVVRQRVEGDRRTNALALTDAGRELLSELTPLVDAHEARLSGNLSEREHTTLIRLLGKILPDAR